MAVEGPIRFLVKLGLLDVILPFVLVFVLTYGLLEKTKVLGKDANRSNILVAVSLGFVVVLTVNVLNILNVLIRYLAVLIVTGVLIAIVYGMAGAQFGKPNKIIWGLLITLFGITVLYALVQVGAINKNRFLGTIIMPFIVLVAIISTIIFVLSPKKTEKNESTPKIPETKLLPPLQ